MWLSEEEQLIIRYLQQVGGEGASGREIGRKAASKDRWKENERWADSFLRMLRDKRVIDTNAAGLYFLVTKEKK
jgi:hypothetical protein